MPEDKCAHKCRLTLYMNIMEKGRGKGEKREITKDGNAGQTGIRRRAWYTKKRTGEKKSRN